MEKLLDKRVGLNEYTGCNEYYYPKNTYNNNYQIEKFECKKITVDDFRKELDYMNHSYYNTYAGPFAYLNRSPYKY